MVSSAISCTEAGAPARMAPFTTATLPLHSWRMFASFSHDQLKRRQQAENCDGSRLRAAIEADAAAGAPLAGKACGMHAIGAQLGHQFETLGWARLHTQPTSFALFHVDRDSTARLRHVHLAGAVDIA